MKIHEELLQENNLLRKVIAMFPEYVDDWCWGDCQSVCPYCGSDGAHKKSCIRHIIPSEIKDSGDVTGENLPDLSDLKRMD